MSESTQSTDSKKDRPKVKTWVWHTKLDRPVFITDVIKIMDKPNVAVPSFEMESDGKGVEEGSATVFNMPAKWEHLSEIVVNPSELDY